MRLKRLELLAYGPFTDRVLEFTGSEPGLHIIYGANEAGKSSALRALKALLFGFPTQTADSFLHSYGQLLVGGLLENDDGRQLEFRRRKKRLGDLLDPDGNTLDGDALAPFLHGLKAEIFASYYGLDHDSLIRGGEEILAQKGEVGQALFAAGAGLSSVREFLGELAGEADALFRPQAKKHPKINQLSRSLSELDKQIRGLSLTAGHWQEVNERYETAAQRRDEMERQRERLTAEISRLERLRQTIPELAEFAARKKQLADLGEVPHLESEFAQQYTLLIRDKRESALQLENDRGRLEDLLQQRENLQYDRKLLRLAEVIDDLHQRLGEYRKGQQDRPERNGMRVQLRTEAARSLRQLRPDISLEEVESLRPLLTKRRTILELSSESAALEQKLQHIGEEKERLEKEQDMLRARLATRKEAVDLQPLLSQIRIARRAGDVDGTIGEESHNIDVLDRQCNGERDRLGLYRGSLEGLLDLPLPLAATVQGYVTRHRELREQRQASGEKRRQAASELRNTHAELQRLQRDGILPTLEDLAAVRTRRDAGWRQVCRNWLYGEEIAFNGIEAGDGKALAAEYEALVSRSDDLADRMQREADRVAMIDSLEHRLEILREDESVAAEELTDIERRLEEEEKAWKEIWAAIDITPLLPEEMAIWLGEMEKLKTQIIELQRRRQLLAKLKQRRVELREGLSMEMQRIGCLDNPGSSGLEPLLASAETVAERITKEQAATEKTRERLEEVKGALQTAFQQQKRTESLLADWRRRWRSIVAGLGVEEEMMVSEAVERMEILQHCFDTLKEAETLDKRIAGIDRDGQQFVDELQSVLADVAPDLRGLGPENAVQQLRERISVALETKSVLRTIDSELSTLGDKVERSERKVAALEAQLRLLVAPAGCTSVEELPEVIERVARSQELQQKIDDSAEKLVRLGAGIPLDELAAQAKEVEYDGLPGRIEALIGSQQDIHRDISQISQEIGEIKGELQQMDGGGRAALLAEEKEEELTRLRRLVRRYVVVRLGERFMEQEIERYRKENEGPIIRLAAEYFTSLTINSFAGLRADIDDKGAPVLVGLRQDGGRLGVEQMSSGTRDQLYLALRLATIKWRQANSEPIPLVVDDILINFDDERSRATLAIMAEMATVNQIILFTHHQRVVEQAQGLARQVQIHPLQPGP